MVTVSPKYQVVIPRAIRDQLRIHPGEQMQVISFDDRIELVREATELDGDKAGAATPIRE